MMALSVTRSEAGFTLAEMLIAMGILAFGMTSLIGFLTVGVDTRRTTEMRHRAMFAVDAVAAAIERGPLAAPLDDDGEWPELQPARWDAVPGHPDLRAKAEFTPDPDDPVVVLVKISVGWLEGGVANYEDFQRIMRRRQPLARRARALLETR